MSSWGDVINNLNEGFVQLRESALGEVNCANWSPRHVRPQQDPLVQYGPAASYCAIPDGTEASRAERDEHLQSMITTHAALGITMPCPDDAYYCYCADIQEPKTDEYGRTLAALQGEEKSYVAVAHRTLFVPVVLQEVAAHLKSVALPLDGAPPAGNLFEATHTLDAYFANSGESATFEH